MEFIKNAALPVILTAVIIGLILFMVKKGSRTKDAHYDEMQMLIRGAGYRIGFFVTLICLFVFALLTELADPFSTVIAPSLCMWTAGFAGIVTFVVYCIMKDAFYAVGQNRKSYIILCACIVAVNVIGSAGHFRAGTLFSREAGFAGYSNLLCAVSFLIILISLAIREIRGRKEVEE